MKANEIRALSEVDIQRELESSCRETFNLRFRRATNQLTNHREIRRIRRKIARLKTIMRERELAQEQR